MCVRACGVGVPACRWTLIISSTAACLCVMFLRFLSARCPCALRGGCVSWKAADKGFPRPGHGGQTPGTFF